MSDKFKVIDHVTFEQLQQSSKSAIATSAVPKIRNAKYKRMAAAADSGFNLLQFVKKADRGGKQAKKRKHKVTKRILDERFKHSFRKKGKQRENGSKLKISRLKKSVLRYRQLKRNQEKMQDEIVTQLEGLKLVANNAPTEVASEKSRIHSGRFRDYCENCTTPTLKQHTERLLRELNRFQRRAYVQNEIKARAHRRLVIGFREVQNFLSISKVKLVIIATDCERCEGTAGLDETISNIKRLCHDQQIPICFPLQRRQLSYMLYKKASISCIGILDYDGARETFQQLLVALNDAREMYRKMQHCNTT
ncbi:selenocysteine insertion sequence-binding protein 2 [Stomoxys calcitrans]|uniref:Ribosomal protein eL8/eL30/eS12/Gadd45 domain-containing protein n=1 Tax=Stomoxys calcitrans TaxID=35570 RepID=A0A1I8PV01_STOCA|nr:selenocysteine insertion sequence-binding protein 2 [Stomoxys calcitrans]